MKLIECYIENFGKLSDFKITFSNGINSIKKNNGYGKTTLTVFIKAMLFGLDSSRRQKLETNERKHYMPWQGGRCGGSLTFEADGKKYRIERTFFPKASDDQFKLYDCKSGKESLDYSERIGEELFGIDEDGFERTVFLSELNLSEKNENKTVSAKLSDLVGYDGDLSVMDDAIELLEKQRKVYYKRGGSGEINDVKAKLSETERKINDLERMKTDYENEKERHLQIAAELTKEKLERDDLQKKSKIIGEARLKQAYAKQYREMKKSLDADKQKENELENFFANGLPSHEQVDEMRELFLEAKRLNEGSGYAESAEYIALSQFFSSEISEQEYEKANQILVKLDDKKKEYELIGHEIEEFQDKEGALSSSNEQKKSKKSGACFFIGIISIIASVALAFIASPILLLLSLIGLILLISGFKIRAIEKKHADKQRKFAAIRNRYESVDAEIAQLKADAEKFISHFPASDKAAIEDTIREIFKKRDIYLALASSQKTLINKKRENSLLANEYAERCRAFLSRFPTVSAKPFDEINKNIIEYEAIKASIQKTAALMAKFAYEHSINPDTIDDVDLSEIASANTDNAELDSKILALEREKTLSERKLSDISEEIERIDELTAEKEKLTEQVELLEKRLDVIQKTKSYLSEAKDSLTSKYLSKTKASFDKYIELIGKELPELFSMNTSFQIMKNERGTFRDSEAYSKGTRDLYALAARLALIDSLYENESPFIVLDDPFAHLDDARLTNAISVIKTIAKDKQIIYLTCVESRKV